MDEDEARIMAGLQGSDFMFQQVSCGSCVRVGGWRGGEGEMERGCDALPLPPL